MFFSYSRSPIDSIFYNLFLDHFKTIKFSIYVEQQTRLYIIKDINTFC